MPVTLWMGRLPSSAEPHHPLERASCSTRGVVLSSCSDRIDPGLRDGTGGIADEECEAVEEPGFETGLIEVPVETPVWLSDGQSGPGHDPTVPTAPAKRRRTIPSGGGSSRPVSRSAPGVNTRYGRSKSQTGGSSTAARFCCFAVRRGAAVSICSTGIPHRPRR